ncbi:MAG: hypothetical protein WC757_02615 [Candidatus Paceibacterota bacterium]
MGIFSILAYLSAQEVSRKPYEQKPVLIVKEKSVFDTASTTAQAVFVFDPTTGETLYEKNADLELPLASVAKIMTAIVASEYSTSTIITVDRQFLNVEGDNGLFSGENWKIRDILSFALSVSSNDAMEAVASHIGSSMANTENLAVGKNFFVDAMNKKATSLNLVHTHFFNPTGLDTKDGTNGAYGSAHDVAVMLWHGVKNFPTIFSTTAESRAEFTSENNKHHTAINTNPLVKTLPGIIASKTGFTDIAGGNLAMAFIAGNTEMPFVAVVLGSTFDERFEDMNTLIRLTRKYMVEYENSLTTAEWNN